MRNTLFASVLLASVLLAGLFAVILVDKREATIKTVRVDPYAGYHKLEVETGPIPMSPLLQVCEGFESREGVRDMKVKILPGDVILLKCTAVQAVEGAS